MGQIDKVNRRKKARNDGKNMFGHDREGIFRCDEISNKKGT